MRNREAGAQPGRARSRPAGPVGLSSREIFQLVDEYRAGFEIEQQGRKRTFRPVSDPVRWAQSKKAAEQLLIAFEPLLVEYKQFIRTGVPTDNTRNLARYFVPELLQLSMASIEDEDVEGELRLCLLQFCLKWDGIVQNFHWEVSNWISRMTKDIFTWRPPLSKSTTLCDPESQCLQQESECDFSDSVIEQLERERVLAWLRAHVPCQRGYWTELFTEAECEYLRVMLSGRAEEQFSVQQINQFTQQIADKVRSVLDSELASAPGSGGPSPSVSYHYQPVF